MGAERFGKPRMRAVTDPFCYCEYGCISLCQKACCSLHASSSHVLCERLASCGFKHPLQMTHGKPERRGYCSCAEIAIDVPFDQAPNLVDHRLF